MLQKAAERELERQITNAIIRETVQRHTAVIDTIKRRKLQWA